MQRRNIQKSTRPSAVQLDPTAGQPQEDPVPLLPWCAFLAGVLSIVAVAAALFLLIHSGALHATSRGKGGFPQLSTPPALPEDVIENVLSLDRPVSQLVVGPSGSIFVAFDSSAHERGLPKLVKWDSAAQLLQPFPGIGREQTQFNDIAALCVAKDAGQLFVLDSGANQQVSSKIWVFDLNSGEQQFVHTFTNEECGWGCTFSDMVATSDGHTLVIADSSNSGNRPRLIAFCMESHVSTVIMENHPSLRNDGGFVPAFQDELLSWYSMNYYTHVSALSLDLKELWLYYAVPAELALYRVELKYVNGHYHVTEGLLDAKIVKFATKSMSKGIVVTAGGNILLSDFQNSAIQRINSSGALDTLVQSDTHLHWVNQLSLDPSGRWVYILCLAPSKLSGPFNIQRVKLSGQ